MIGINGFGRIGRCITRALVESNYQGIAIGAINTGSEPLDTHLHLLKYDSSHGTFHDVRKLDDTKIELGGKPVDIITTREPSAIDWKSHGVEIVLECTGKFTNKSSALQHIDAGAKHVIVSAPCKDADSTIVLGVNNDILSKEHKIISIGSCTTNCLAPIAKTLNDAIGIENGFMTTIHAYTNDQKVLDARHKDKRRARTCGTSIIPTSTGAAKAIGTVLPELDGKLDGGAIRVPVPNVSMVELTFNAARNTSIAEINSLMVQASEEKLKGILGYTEEDLVSIDFNHSTFSTVFDSGLTKVSMGTFCKISAWYDNEWGFAHRMLDLACNLSKL